MAMNRVDWNFERIWVDDLDEQIKQLADVVPSDKVRQWQPTFDRQFQKTESIFLKNLKNRRLLSEHIPARRPEVNMNHIDARTQGLSYPFEAPLSHLSSTGMSKPVETGLSSPAKPGSIHSVKEESVRSTRQQLSPKPTQQELQCRITDVRTQHVIEISSESNDDSDDPEDMNGNEDVKPQVWPKSSYRQSPTEPCPSSETAPKLSVADSGTSKLIPDQEKFENIRSAYNGPELSRGTTDQRVLQTDMTTSIEAKIDGGVEMAAFKPIPSKPTKEQEKRQDADYIPVSYVSDEDNDKQHKTVTNPAKSHSKDPRPRPKIVVKPGKISTWSLTFRANSSKGKKIGPRKKKNFALVFECPECPFVAKSEGGFKKHRGAHLNPRAVYCKECTRPFSKNCHLQHHMRRDHGSVLATSAEHSDDSTRMEADGNLESDEYDHAMPAENCDYEENLETYSDGPHDMNGTEDVKPQIRPKSSTGQSPTERSLHPSSEATPKTPTLALPKADEYDHAMPAENDDYEENLETYSDGPHDMNGTEDVKPQIRPKPSAGQSPTERSLHPSSEATPKTPTLTLPKADEYDHAMPTENDDYEERHVTQAEGVSGTDGKRDQSINVRATVDDTGYIDHLKPPNDKGNENRLEKCQERKRICPDDEAKKTLRQAMSWKDSPGPSTKRQRIRSNSSNTEKNVKHLNHEETPQITPPRARSFKNPEKEYHATEYNTDQHVSSFTDFSERPYSCSWCVFRTGETDALKEHCMSHTPGGTNEPKDDSRSVSSEKTTHHTDHRGSFNQPPVLIPYADYPSSSLSPPLNHSVPTNAGEMQANPQRVPYLLLNPGTLSRLTSSPALINPWMKDTKSSLPPYQRTEDLMEQGEDYEKDPSKHQQYKCRYCTRCVNTMRRLIRHFDNCHKDIVMTKAVQSRRCIEVINLT